MALSGAQIKQSQDGKREKVFVPEWAPDNTPESEAYVWVRTLTGTEYSDWQNELMEKRGNKKGRMKSSKGIRESLIVKACVDDNGQPLFDEDDLAWLCDKSAAPINRMWNRITELNCIGEDEEEELEKNLERIKRNSSGTD